MQAAVIIGEDTHIFCLQQGRSQNFGSLQKPVRPHDQVDPRYWKYVSPLKWNRQVAEMDGKRIVLLLLKNS